MRDVVKRAFARKLRAYLTVRGESYRGFADRTGMSHHTINALANEKAVPNARSAWTCSQALNCRVSDLVS